MSIYEFDEQGTVTRETYIDTSAGRAIRFCEWFFDGITLEYTCYRNRNAAGNYYTTSRKHDPQWWIKNKTRENLLAQGLITA